MKNIRGDIILLNGKLQHASDYIHAPSSTLYYEVIRVINGKYIFLDDHLERLNNSCIKGGCQCPEKELLYAHLRKIVAGSKIHEGNVKLIIEEQGDRQNIITYFVTHYYPSERDYSSGVLTKTYFFERPDPTVKRWNETFRTNVNHFIQTEKIYEAILVNEKGKLTEGSRSNLFFIDDDDRIITAPENIILPGITRKYILQICQQHAIKLVDKALSVKEAAKMRGCFITGTSPKVLPVKMINEIDFQTVSTLMNILVGEYDRLIFEQLQD